MNKIKILFILMISAASYSGGEKVLCFNKICSNFNKKSLEEDGFKSIKDPTISRKNSKSDKLLRESKEPNGLKEIVDIDSSGRICSMKVFLKRNDSMWKRLKEVLEENRVNTDLSSIIGKVKQNKNVRFIRQRIIFNNYDEGNTPITIQVSKNQLEISFYFNLLCDPSSKILEEPPLPN